MFLQDSKKLPCSLVDIMAASLPAEVSCCSKWVPALVQDPFEARAQHIKHDMTCACIMQLGPLLVVLAHAAT